MEKNRRKSFLIKNIKIPKNLKLKKKNHRTYFIIIIFSFWVFLYFDYRGRVILLSVLMWHSNVFCQNFKQKFGLGSYLPFMLTTGSFRLIFAYCKLVQPR
jgi:hypothetical protein